MSFSSDRFWTGYTYNDNTEDLFWSDGHRVTDDIWMDGITMDGDCVVIDREGKWKSEKCSNKNNFICILEVPYGNNSL